MKGEQQLDLLVLPERQWYRDMGRRAAKAQEHRVNLACWALNGRSDPTSPWTPEYRPGAILSRDIAVPEEATEVERHYATVLSCWDLPDECGLTRRLLDEMARIKGGSPFVQEDLKDAPLEPVRRLIERDLTEAAIAATRYRLRHGRLPNSWEELTSAGLLKTVPLDLFTGKPTTMKVAPDHVLFSAGSIQAIAASRPLWEVFGTPQASTLPAKRGK